MDIPTKNLSDYISKKGISLRNMALSTGISYQRLIDSLSQNGRGRDLRAGEFITICKFLDQDPIKFHERNYTE